MNSLKFLPHESSSFVLAFLFAENFGFLNLGAPSPVTFLVGAKATVFVLKALRSGTKEADSVAVLSVGTAASEESGGSGMSSVGSGISSVFNSSLF